MKKISVIVFGLLILMSSCRNPITELKEFKLNMNSNLANTPIRILFKSNNPNKPLPNFISVKLSGVQVGHFYDLNGQTEFPVSAGALDLIIGPNANPSESNPISVTIEANAVGFAPIRQEVFFFSKDKRVTVQLGFNDIQSITPGITATESDLNFLGKKKTDTISFEMTRKNDGVRFVVKYPIKDLLFVKSKNVKFKVGVRVNFEEVYNDSTVLTYDTISKPIYETFVSVQEYNGQIAEEKRITGYKMEIEAKSTVAKRVFVGYRFRDSVPIYETKRVFDTIPLQNVAATISSASDFLENGFYNEKNEYIDKPRFFTGVVGLPNISFYDKSLLSGSDNYITPIYLSRGSGKIVEVYLPNNDYNLFVSGVAQSLTGDYFYSVKRGIDLLDNKNFVAYGNGFKMTLVDNLINGQYFLYKNSLVGCGFTKVKITHPLVDFNRGFYGGVFIYNDSGSVSYSYSLNDYLDNNGNEVPEIYSIPTFTGVNTNIELFLNHPLNIDTNTCSRKPDLYWVKNKINLCNYLSSGYSINIPYNMVDFFNTLQISNPIPVNLTAVIECSGGNKVIPPDIVLYYRKLDKCSSLILPEPGSSAYGSVKLVDGVLKSTAFEADASYEILYQRVSSIGNLLNIYDTITFYKNPSSYSIRDEITNYWVGNIKYTGSSFDIDFVFDNRKLKYDIRGCDK
jgi:hypothetical protein